MAASRQTQSGFIALISAVIITAILLGLTFATGVSGFNARFDVLNSENKRISLGLAESCQNVALLKIAQNTTYQPAVSGDSITVQVGPPSQTCVIQTVNNPAFVNHKKTVTITTQASFDGAFSNVVVSSTVQDPTVTPVTPAPTCTLSISPSNIFAGNTAVVSWASSIGATSLTIDNGVGSVSPVAGGQKNVTPAVSTTYTGTVTGPGGSNTCVPSVSVVVQPPPTCADTLMMLDRTGSMSSSDLSSERTAANSLLNLYKNVSPAPQSATGSFGGLDGSAASVPANGQLSTNFTNLTSAVNTITGSSSTVGSDLGAAITAGNNELSSTRHQAGYQKVMVMLSDGVPNEPSNTTGNSANLYPNTIGNFNTWSATGISNKVTAVADASNSTYVSQGSDAETFKLANANIPTGAVINSLTLNVVAKAASGTPTIQLMVENGTGSNQQIFDSGHTLSGNYVSYSWIVPTTPSGAAWTLSEVNNWTTRFGVFKSTAGGSVRVTNVYAVINYSTNMDTGWVSPSAQAADSGGDGNGFETSPTSAYADGGGFATNVNGTGDRHRFYNYNLNIPAGAVVNGIVVRPDWWLDSTSGTNDVGIELSWDGGSHWTAAKTENTETISDANNKTVGSSNDTWNRTWSLADFSNANFRVRITSNSSSSTRDFYLDWLPVRVYYSIPGSQNTTASSVGNFDQWSVNVGTKQAAVATNDNDTTYISEGSLGQTFAVSKAGVPAGATINSVTLNALAEQTGGNAAIKLMVENGTNQSFDAGHNLTGSYANYSWQMNTNPLTGASWTLTEVNNWTTKFGVSKSSATAAAQVSQIYLIVNYTILGDPSGSAAAAANTAKNSGTQIFAIHFGDASGETFLKSLASQNTTTANIISSGAARASNVVTITTAAPHGFYAGQQVVISGVSSSSFNGTFVIASVPASNKFTYSQSGSNATSGNGTAAVNQNFFVSPTASDMQGIFQAIAGIVCPAAAPPGAPPPLPPAPPPPALPPNITLGSWIENK